MKVSVLMPVYNAEAYLAQAIDSIISQTFTEWELILVNDGSTDKSEEIILSYSDSRIRYSKNSENKGIIYTRNLMIEMSLGEYIAFLDSDDISLPTRLEQQITFLDNNPDYALCGTWSIMSDKDGRKIRKINMPSSNEDIKCSLLFINTFVQSSIMIRKEILIQHSYNKNFPVAEDYELWCRLSRLYKLKNLPIHLTQYRWHGDNISQSKKTLMDNLVKDIYRRELNYIGINPTNEELLLHAAIKDKTIVDISTEEYLKALKLWLIKLANHADENKAYNRDIFISTLVFRWIFACKEWQTPIKALSLPISLNIKQYRILFKMLRQRI
ncbi:glycosyltransferase [Dysgonomonas sp. Marseille-P4677]|uniref:glycosyltransferase family 2 protein n=1 Tax=Dysgonomonas sp. Marseille-P4677 TaxID=2364790 RepID=UPI0019128279|nr:glycosyltransferase [Dysgonomonas sp. Marseille-P4677]MBK5720417.1 glycosyltransferase [Dysgonomonas sp. Marseille-P4677]